MAARIRPLLAVPLDALRRLAGERWGLDGARWAELEDRRRVAQLVMDAVEARDGALTEAQLEDLDFEALRCSPNGRQWAAHELDRRADDPAIAIEDDLRARLAREIGSFFAGVLVGVRRRGDADGVMLARVVLPAESSRKRHAFVLAICPRAKYLLASGLPAAHRDCLWQAIALALGADRASAMKLAGSDLDSLLEMLLHGESQGPFAQYRVESSAATNPLARAPKRAEPDEPAPDDVRARRRQAAEAQFGAHRSAALQKVQIVLEREGGAPAKVVLQGDNVIEGIKALITEGHADPPLPDFLARLTSMRADSFVVGVDGSLRVEGTEGK